MEQMNRTKITGFIALDDESARYFNVEKGFTNTFDGFGRYRDIDDNDVIVDSDDLTRYAIKLIIENEATAPATEQTPHDVFVAYIDDLVSDYKASSTQTVRDHIISELSRAKFSTGAWA